MSIHIDLGNGWEPLPGIASVAVDEPEPGGWGDGMAPTSPEPHSATVPFEIDLTHFSTAYDSAGWHWVSGYDSKEHARFMDSPDRRRRSRMRAAYRAKTKHRRRNR